MHQGVNVCARDAGYELMATTPEGRVKASIKRYLKAVPNCWYFMPIGGPFSVHGVPDIVGLCNGRFFAIECKAPLKHNNLTANQERALAFINAAGGVAFVASSVEDVRSRFVTQGWAHA
jgi:hypothetical protein